MADWTFLPNRHGKNLMIRATNATGKSQEIVSVAPDKPRENIMADHLTLEDLDRLKEILGPSSL